MKGRPQSPRASFEEFEASLLHCPTCREAVPVRKRLLLVLPHGDEFEYLCTRCGASCGTKLDATPPGSGWGNP